MVTIDPDKVTVVQVQEGEQIEHVGRLRREKRKIRVNRVWHVIYNGTIIGSVIYKLITRELRTPGRTYVNARWQSPGWAYRNGEARSAYDFHRPLECYSKKDAVERIIRDYERSLS